MARQYQFLSSEDAEQEAVVEYCDIRGIPIVHIPNEGKRSISYAAKLKRMGLRKGFPDLFVPKVRYPYHGLFIEMKYGKNRTSKEQNEWITKLSVEGYVCGVCRGFDEAVNLIEDYLKLK